MFIDKRHFIREGNRLPIKTGKQERSSARWIYFQEPDDLVKS